MSEENSAPDLFDLKFLPAWVKEAPNDNRYADFAGEENVPPGARDRRDRRGGGERRERGPRPPRANEKGRDPRGRERRPADFPAREPRRQEESLPPAPAVEIRFAPAARVLENVLPQIKSGHLAYSVFSLARMFLDKPERYDVRLKAETATLFQSGELGPVASDRRLLENGAFVNQKDNFYRTETIQSEPIKGNFTSVARCRLSGTLLGPTNHHAYQAHLRGLYEQRFSRRMSFPDYQRQIEIVTDPEIVEKWKEEARSVTTYVTLLEDPPKTFSNAAETERHFRQNYLPGLIAESAEVTLGGAASRRLPDRALNLVIENAWSQEFRSPTKMMQELIGAFRQSALHIFRHRKGMLFVSSLRPKAFSQDTSSLSTAMAAILAALRENAGVSRNQLLEKLPHDGATEAEAVEKRKLALASNLHWLIREGHVIEFNDGALDLPRAKSPASVTPADRKNGKAVKPSSNNSPEDQPQEAPAASAAETPASAMQAPASTTDAPSVSAEEVSGQSPSPDVNPASPDYAAASSAEDVGQELEPTPVQEIPAQEQEPVAESVETNTGASGGASDEPEPAEKSVEEKTPPAGPS
ncbi:MAG: hypothetical protein ACR2G0_11075 [Chthoniobacterales bacterium]